MKKPFLILAFIFSLTAYAQSFNEDKSSMVNYLKRMYTSTPFEGVKVVQDYDHQYLVSVLSLDKTKYTNTPIMNLVAQVKAQSQGNTYLNGTSISSDMVIETTKQKNEVKTSTVVETIKDIKENATGFSQGLELLTNFENESTKRMVFMYYREIKKQTKEL
jgi:6-pyruvoyl-tetrahydropterin synthase